MYHNKGEPALCSGCQCAEEQGVQRAEVGAVTVAASGSKSKRSDRCRGLGVGGAAKARQMCRETLRRRNRAHLARWLRLAIVLPLLDSREAAGADPE